MKLEPVQGDLLPKRERNKHHCRCHLFRESRCHFACVNGSTSNRESTTKTHLKSRRRWPDCFDMVFLYFEKKTEQLTSKFLAPMFASKFASSPHWSIRTWLSYLQGGGGPKKRFQYCFDPYSAETILYLRAIQGRSGGKRIHSALQDNVLLPSDFAEYIYHLGNSHDMQSIIQSGLIPGEKRDQKRETDGILHSRESYATYLHKERDYGVTKPRIAVYKKKSESTPDHSILGQFEGCSEEEGIDVLSNEI